MTDSYRQSLIRWLAERVLGWHHRNDEPWRGHWFVLEDGEECLAADPDWNPLDSWADTGTLWPKGLTCTRYSATNQRGWVAKYKGEVVYADSGPEALCLAVARATGFQGEEPCE